MRKSIAILAGLILCPILGHAATRPASKKPETKPQPEQHRGHISRFLHGSVDLMRSEIKHPFYIGLTGGYGNSTWDQISVQGVEPYDPSADTNNPTIDAVPINAKSGGFTGGAFAGYQFSRHFAIEMMYLRFENVNLHFYQGAFAPMSIANLYQIGPDGIKTHTETYNFYGKFMIPFGFTSAKAYASAGATVIHRWDDFVGSTSRVVPNFGVGISYDITSRIITDLGFLYTAGYAKASAKPALYYIPFTYYLHWDIGVRL